MQKRVWMKRIEGANEYQKQKIDTLGVWNCQKLESSIVQFYSDKKFCRSNQDSNLFEFGTIRILFDVVIVTFSDNSFLFKLFLVCCGVDLCPNDKILIFISNSFSICIFSGDWGLEIHCYGAW